MKKYLYIFLSFYIVFFTTTSAYAASPVGWVTSPADILIGAAGNTVTAIKGAGASALQSTVKHAPTVGNIGKKILKGGGAGAVLMAVTQILGKSVDYVLDPANNRIKYTETTEGDLLDKGWTGKYPQTIGKYFASAELACQAVYPLPTASNYGQNGNAVLSHVVVTGNTAACYHLQYGRPPASGVTMTNEGVYTPPKEEEKYIPIDTVAAKVQSNAAAGEPSSQEFIKTVIIDDVNAGVLDVPLNTNAVPQADAPPVNPPHDPTKPVPPFDPSSIIAAIKSVMAAVVNMSGVLGAKIDALMIDLGLKHDEKLVADAANTAAIVSAIEAIEGNTLDGKVINDAVDRVIANDNAKVSDIVAAIEAIEGNTLTGEVLNDAIDRAIANDDAIAQRAIEAAEAAEAARTTADQANTTAITDAIDAQTDAMTTTDPTTGETALKLPGFCSWASPVCTFIDWTKAQWLEFVVTFTALKDWLFEDSPANDKDNTVDTVTPPIVPAQVAINFVGSCPAPLTFSFQFYGQNYKPSVPFDPVCEVAILVNPIIKICATIAAAFIAAGIRQGAK